MDGLSASDLDLGLALLYLLWFVPLIGIGLAAWAMLDAWTVKDRPQGPTWFVAAISAVINAGMFAMAVFFVGIHWVALIPASGIALTVLAGWRIERNGGR